MANTTNKLILRGNVVSDATARGAYVTVNVAVSGLKHQDGSQEQASYYNVTQRYSDEEKATAATEKLKKGVAVLVNGKLNRRQYTKKDGTAGYANDVYAARIETCTGLMPGAELTLHGRLSKDPERHGKTVVVTMPVAGPYEKDAAEQPVFWMNNITFFGDVADRVEKNLHKGDSVTVVGRLEDRAFTRKDGTKGTNLSLSCNAYPMDVHKLAGAATAPDAEDNVADDAAEFAPLEDDDAELPF